MSFPAFRFVAVDIEDGDVGNEFWRDVEASERLPSAAAADRFIRELCRAKARETLPAPSSVEMTPLAERERHLLGLVRNRGYRVAMSV